MHLAQILFIQGFGTRRQCAGIVAAGRVRIGGQVVDDPHADVATEDLVFEVEGRPWPYRERALLMLHKPAGYECSQKPRHHPSVLSLLPPPTDDGALIHRLTSPKWHVPKVYEVGTKHPVTDEQVARLLAGVVLDDDPAPVRAAACERTGELALTLTLTEGKYHQVKRMVAAIENRCDALHRSRFGALSLPADLKPGQWIWVDADSAIVMARSEAGPKA